MKKVLLFVAAVLVVLSVVGGGALLRAHFDEPSDQIGEYQVRLNDLKVTQFIDDWIFPEAQPDVFIKTFVQAENHIGEFAAFDKGDQPVGNVIPIGALIYWHLDCPDSEQLSLVVDVADRDGGIVPPVLQAALAMGGGVLAKAQPVLAPALDKVGQELIKALDTVIAGSDQFPQFSSGGFTIDDNAGTRMFTSASGGIGVTGQYEFSASFSYITRDIKCTDANLHKLQIELAQNDPEIRSIKERLTNLALQSGKQLSVEGIHEGLTNPVAALNYALGELDLRDFLVETHGETLAISIDQKLDEFTVFTMLGAAAAAFDGTGVRFLTVRLHESRYDTSMAAISNFLAVPQDHIGSGAFVISLLQHIEVTSST